jgi:fumarate reductase flavoprotein subunit
VRFADEATGRVPFVSGNTLLRQPDRVGYVLFDERIRKHLAGMRFPARKPASEKNRLSARPSEPLPALDTDGVLLEELRRGALRGIAIIATSWTEIAEWIGASPRALSETIEEYNSHCASGCDRDFAKDRRYLQPLIEPPFFAVRTVTVLLDTLGGVKTNTRMEVVDTDGTPIPGAYAAGVLVDGFQPDTYCGELPGSAFGFAVNSGRIAGENAALRAREGHMAH